jgi:hypothetical protein
MNANTESQQSGTAEEVSLVRGGPFYRLQQALRLVRSDRWNVPRRVLVLLAIGWLPLFVITAITNPDGLLSLLKEYRLHARMLVAVPVLLIGEIIMDMRFRRVFAHIRRAQLLGESDLKSMDAVIASLVRVRDTVLPELVVIALLIVHTAVSYRGLTDATPWLVEGTGAKLRLSPAAWYAIVVTAPIFQFLLGLGIWKWLLWTYYAFKLSRMKLRLVPTHPDRHGGLGFLGLSSGAFAPIAFSATAVIAATWRDDILHHGAHLINFKGPMIFFAVLVALIALGPLAFFVPRLSALRREGILEYGILGQLHSVEFHERWILHRAGHEAEFLAAPESSTLADFGSAYEKIAEINAFPADKGTLYTLAAAVLIPALPMILAQVPFTVVLGDLFKAIR